MREKSARKQRLARRPEALVRAVVDGDLSAWHRLVESSIGFVYSLAWSYARGDRELADELVLAVFEGLRRPDAEGRAFYRLRIYLDSLEEFGSRSRFTTWLAQVARNLFRDFFRQRQGRRLLPQTIEGLEESVQEVFQALFWDGLTEAEALGKLRQARPGLEQETFDIWVGQVYRALEDRQLWKLYRDLMRRLPALPLDTPSLPLAEGRRLDRPDDWLEAKENWHRAQELGHLLQKAVRALPKTTRWVLQMALVQDLSGLEIQRIMGFSRRQRVYDLLAKARRQLRLALAADGVGLCDLARVEGWLDGWLHEEK